jgi:hypothetical protein
MKSILLILVATLGITAASTAQNVPSYIPTNGLVGWWPFNGNANDESGNGNDGTVNGATLTSDRFGNTSASYLFVNSLESHISVLNFQNLPTGNSPFSISAWIKNNGYENGTITFWGQPQSNLNNELRLYGEICPANSGIGAGWWSPNQVTYCDPTLNDLNWHHVISIFDGIILKLYLDGNNIQSINPSSQPNVYNGSFSIGGQPWATGITNGFNDYYFEGEIDDIAIWNRALTPQEITALYTASPTNNNETSNTSANVPGAIHYQAVARDAQGMPLADANLQVRFTLIADSLSGTAEYVETHSLTTNSLGLFTTAFGAGTPVSSTFGNINWSSGNKFLKVQIDTGNGLVDIGTQQLLSTPYSMHSATSGAIKNPGLPVFEDNAAALAGGLVAGDMYRTASGDLKIVY